MAYAEPSTGDAPEIEDGLYDVTCVKVSDPFEELDFNGQKKIQKVRIFFQVHGTDDGEGNEIVLDPKVNLKWSPGGNYPASTLFLYATALCGPQDGDIGFDTDNLIKKTARATIKTETGKWPRITDLMPPKKTGTGIDMAKLNQAFSGAPTTVDDVPFDTDDKPSLRDALADASAAADIVEQAKKNGYTQKEIMDLAESQFHKRPADLNEQERAEFRKALGV